MAIAICPYTEDRIPAVQAFNRRLAEGGIAPEFHFPESNVPYWLPKLDGRRIYQQYYLALDGDFVRGAFILKFQDFCVAGESRSVVYYHLPVSEGIVNKAYASVGVLMLRSAVKMQPTLFALGMGGFDRPLPTMLKAMGWSLSEVPFYFWVNHPAAFLREIAPLRQSPGRRLLAGVAAGTGTGHLGIKLLQTLRSKTRVSGASLSELVTSFDSWADDLWRQHAAAYPLIAHRTSTTLNVLYPAGREFICLKTTRGSQTLGWAVVLDTQMRENKYFGNLRVGTIADCFASPENAAAVVQAATRVLEERGVDLIIANHSHTVWGEAFRSCGYFQGPSNFIFAAAKPLAEMLVPFEANQNRVYFMRGDGDGPVNL
jgi:hypothetical protein